MNYLRRPLRYPVLSLAALVALSLAALPATSLAQQEMPPPPSAPRSVHFPKPVEKTLKNGLRVIVVEREGVPLVSAQLLVRAGGETDPQQLSGLAQMTATLLTKGTTTRSATEIAQAIEALGGTLNSGARWDASSVSTNIMSSRLGQAMEILADVVRHPAFKDEEIERLRKQNLDGLRVSLRDPGAIASLVAARVIFGDTPYGHPLGGTLETIPLIKREDIQRQHQSYYRPDNAVLVIGGTIKPADAFNLAERVFGDWQKPAGALPTSNTTASAMQANQSSRVIVIDKPDAGQAAVVLARAGIKRTDQDYFRGIVANSILSGYSGRLNQEIRIKRGLSYGAGSSLDVRRDVGPFVASAQTKNESGAEVASLLMGELARLSEGQLSDVEMTPRKAVLIGSFARNLETSGGLVGQVSSLALYGLSLDEINNYIKNVQAISSSDVQQFAGGRLSSKGANLIIVGDASKFLDSLRKQFPNVEVIREADLDLNSASLHRSTNNP
ncbi:MAG: zinc protease [Acidobacteriota bacterium]|nr:zinc protease [Acidobacteriota bacterium]